MLTLYNGIVVGETKVAWIQSFEGFKCQIMLRNVYKIFEEKDIAVFYFRESLPGNMM